MKSTGIVRPIDHMGRIVIPMELRRTMELSDGDRMEIFTDGDKIVLSKYDPVCVFCGEGRDVTLFRGRAVCSRCFFELRSNPDENR